MRYPNERKVAVLKKILPPHNQSLVALAMEKGISAATLYNRRKSARAEGRLLPDGDRTPPRWASADKVAAVVKSAAMNEAGLAAYCRKLGCTRNRSLSGGKAVNKPTTGIAATTNVSRRHGPLITSRSSKPMSAVFHPQQPAPRARAQSANLSALDTG